MTTVYSINNGAVLATNCMIFGWSFAGTASWLPEEFHSLAYGDNFNVDQLKELRRLFVGNLYPDELRQALDKAIQKLESSEVAPYSRSEIDADMDALESLEDQKTQVAADQVVPDTAPGILFIRKDPTKGEVNNVGYDELHEFKKPPFPLG